MTDNNPTTSSPASIDPINDAVRALEVLDGGGGLSPDETADLVRGLLAVIARLTRERDAWMSSCENSRRVGALQDIAAERDRNTIARLTRERDDAAVYSRDVCYAVENVRVMLAGTLDALDAARARLGTVEGSVWPTT